MTERIRELATEAGLQPFEDCGPGYVAKMEKFAELVWKAAYQQGLSDGAEQAILRERG